MRIYPELLVDQEFKSLGDQGFSGTLNDRQFAFLRSKGYTNSLADMMASWLSYSPANLFSLNEPGAWYDPSDITTLFQDTAGTTPVTATGQSVARINDKSGRGNDATQATLAQRPTYQIDGNGRPYLLFDGVDDSMVTPTITPGIDKVQVFAGLRKLSDALAIGVFCELSAATPSNNGAFRLGAPGSGASYGWLSKGTILVQAVASGFAAPTTNVVTGIGDISGDVATIRVNGVDTQTTTTDQGTGNFLAYPLYLGRRGGVGNSFNGQMYSLIVRFGSNLDNTTITRTENWVNSKTGAY